LVKQLGVKRIIVGDDFRYGQGRKGDVTLLKKMGESLAVQVDIMPAIMMGAERISSTRIRQALQAGDDALAESLLGRPYSMMGRVVLGDQRGRVLGYPTANIFLHRVATPVMGVYIVRLYGIADKSLPGVANVGIRPTIGGTRILLEVHLLNFNQNIYGKYVTVTFGKKLRDEKRYDNLDLLKDAIGEDVAIARDYFIKTGELV
jgi:riboflavin kinase/FMN adenylyltransferase